MAQMQAQIKEISFEEFLKKLQQNFEVMTKDENHLYKVDVDVEHLWNLYLDSFPPGTNEIYRTRRFYDCSCCRHFVKQFGNVVTIKDNKVRSIWRFQTDDPTYQPVLNSLADFVESKQITDVFVTRETSFGTEKSFERSEEGDTTRWDHFYIELSDKFRTTSPKTIDTIRSGYRDVKTVFERSLTEISENSVMTVLELIAQKSLYKGEEWERNLRQFLAIQKEFIKTDAMEKNNYLWVKSLEVGPVIGKIKNHSIGVLLKDISDGMDLDQAVKRYEKIVAPTNYKRPKPIFTQKMLDDAKTKLEELGLVDSLERRFAVLEDITINNVLFSNRDSAKRMKGNIFEELSLEISNDPKKFSKVEDISIDKFIEDVLPSTKTVEVMVEGKHLKNMVSLIAPVNPDSKTLFKWDNNFSWTYTGNITDSGIKENVKMAGGNVRGVLRFSIQWNDIETDKNDNDAQCIEPKGNHISFMRKTNSYTSGMLDVDIIRPQDIPAVENITWTNKSKMETGTYKFFVNCYYNHGGKSGFRAEIEVDGQIYKFDYNKPLRHKERVEVAEVHFDGKNFTVKEKLPSSVSSREVWGIKTNQFVPVSIIMFSPNYWNNKGVGNKHYFFMLKGCINNENPSGFFNEYLKDEYITHKRVFEALSGKMRVQDVEDQLSGIGFSSTQHNSVLVKVVGKTDRVLKVTI